MKVLTDRQYTDWCNYVHEYNLMDYGHATRIKAWHNFCTENNIDPQSRLRHEGQYYFLCRR